jgi:hypoxanthine-DNA glycosylase
MRKSSFAPVVASDTRVLILGSLPGEASLAAARYYAHPQNQFWRLVGSVIERDLASLDYPGRLCALLAAGIGLWDTVATAERRGSLDGALRAIKRTPLAELAATLPGLRAVGFNGATAAKLGRKALPPSELELIDLPSSSPANARLPFAAKAQSWGRLREFLEPPLQGPEAVATYSPP